MSNMHPLRTGIANQTALATPDARFGSIDVVATSSMSNTWFSPRTPWVILAYPVQDQPMIAPSYTMMYPPPVARIIAIAATVSTIPVTPH